MRMINKLIAWLKYLRQPAGLLPVVRDAIPWAGIPPATRVTTDVRVATNGRAYKIVQNLKGELWSYLTLYAVVDDPTAFAPLSTELRYFPGHATQPWFGKLFVMDSLRHAEAMLSSLSRNGLGTEIWEADVCGEEPLAWAYLKDAPAFWAGAKGDPNQRSAQWGCSRLPVGTLVCNTVTLRRRVA